MGKSPEPPGGGAPQPKPAHFDNGGESSDGGEIAIVVVLEGAGRRVPLDSGVDDVGGMAVHIASRVTDLAGPGEVLVSGTVFGTVVGGPFEFEERGLHELKGVPGRWPLFALGA